MTASTLSRNWQLLSKRQRTDNKQTVTFAWPVEVIPVRLSSQKSWLYRLENLVLRHILDGETWKDVC